MSTDSKDFAVKMKTYSWQLSVVDVVKLFWTNCEYLYLKCLSRFVNGFFGIIDNLVATSD